MTPHLRDVFNTQRTYSEVCIVGTVFRLYIWWMCRWNRFADLIVCSVPSDYFNHIDQIILCVNKTCHFNWTQYTCGDSYNISLQLRFCYMYFLQLLYIRPLFFVVTHVWRFCYFWMSIDLLLHLEEGLGELHPLAACYSTSQIQVNKGTIVFKAI